MCSRFSLAEERDFLATRLGVSAKSLANYRPRYNIAPRQEHFIVTTEYENRKLTRARWGLLSIPGNQGREQYSINARAETVESRPTFAEAFGRRRCLIPASGFYEWAGPSYARQPYWIHRRDDDLLLFAGLYAHEEADDNGVPINFTILTCAANPTLATIHDRMPVILSDRDADDWMNPGEQAPFSLKSLLIPAPEALLLVQLASPLVNNVKNEGPELLASSGTKWQMSFNF
ncbi:MAG: SOS response-associated peptidase [Acidobacteriaceae bacterium]|nr:SOS response-associated peptidase [Acidobacteriaceae bacterium]